MTKAHAAPPEMLKRLEKAGAEKLVNQKELADIMGVTPGTVRRLVANGVLPKPGRMGKHRFWKVGNVLREFRRFISNQVGDETATIRKDL